MYYDDILYRNIVLNKIFNPNKQLHLDLSDCDNITDASLLRNVYDLNLSYCKNIINVRALGNYHTLNLSYCDKITDVNMLGNLHTLRLLFHLIKPK